MSLLSFWCHQFGLWWTHQQTEVRRQGPARIKTKNLHKENDRKMTGNIKKASSESRRIKQRNPQKRKLDNFFNTALRRHNSYKQQEVDSSFYEPMKKKSKPARHGRQTYKKEIAEMLSKKSEADKKEKPMLSSEDHEKLKQQLGQRRKFFKGQPRFWIREHGLKAILELSVEDRVPLFVGDVQHLVLFALLGNKIHQEHNRWCHLERHGLVSQVVVVLLEGVGAGDLVKPLKKLKDQDDSKQTEKNISTVFPHAVELVNPETYNRSLADDFCLVPLSAKMCRSMLLTFGNKQAELKSKVFRAAFPVSIAPKKAKEEEKSSPEGDAKESSGESEEEEEVDDKKKKASPKKEHVEPPQPMLHPADKFSRLELLLSPSQMIEEGYAVPIGQMAYKYQHYVYTKDHYAEVTPLSPMFGLDCEMCMTTARKNELTRISIVDENHHPVYETLVMPHNRIINYLTQYSGITPQMMRGVKTTLQDVHNDIRRILPPDAILMFHPYVIDSSVVFNVWGQRKRKTKLKTLVSMFLGEKIQQDDVAGHDSIEDSIASLKLYRDGTVINYIIAALEFGDAVLGFDVEKAQENQPEEEEKKQEKEEEGEAEEYKQLPMELPQPEVIKIMEASSLFKLVARRKKVGLFAMPDVIKQYSKYLSGHHEMAGTKFELRAGSHGFEVENNYKAIKRLLKEGPMFDLAVTHLKVNIDCEKQRARAINSCLKVAESVQQNGMVIIVAGGRPKSETDGRPDHRPACFVHLNLQAPPNPE
ncbi:hypothetical protein B566_EDAN015657 [Ephemera danica]|nr:hypothetical protein B566_EDAN015657 [Ephemera danica]